MPRDAGVEPASSERRAAHRERRVCGSVHKIREGSINDTQKYRASLGLLSDLRASEAIRSSRAYEEHHGREQLLLTSGDERDGGSLERLADVVGALGRETDLLEAVDGRLRDNLAEPGHSEHGEDVPERLAFPDIALERVVPRLCA